jgi:hypothetical protein
VNEEKQMTGFLKRLFSGSISRDKAKRIAGKACALPLDSMEVFDTPPEGWRLYRLEGDEPCWYVRVPSEFSSMMLQSSRVLVVSRKTGNVLYIGSAGDEG